MYQIDGVLYWSITFRQKFNGIARDIWTDPYVISGAAGDGYLIYPGANVNDDPVPSLRLELIRHGNEDFEMLYVL